LRPVTDVTKLNPSVFSKVFLNFFSILVSILDSYLGSYQHALFNFSYVNMCILLSVTFVILLKCLRLTLLSPMVIICTSYFNSKWAGILYLWVLYGS
jgi:hypothetical protein